MSKELDLYDLIKQEESAKREYEEILASGMMFEWFPQLTGDFSRDELEWMKIYNYVTEIRNNGLKR